MIPWPLSTLGAYQLARSEQLVSSPEDELGRLSEKVIGKKRQITSSITQLDGPIVSRSSNSTSDVDRGYQDASSTDGSTSYSISPAPAPAPTTDSNTSSSHRSGGSGFEGAGKYLLSGGIAGAVSRTATAPLDRLKIYLITAQPSNSTTVSTRLPATRRFSHLWQSLTSIYNEHSNCNQKEPLANGRHKWGIRNFFIGNGLNVIKVFPESAIKFFVYEYCKKLFDRYRYRHLDHSYSDVNQLPHRSNLSRFMAGGVAGVVSQVLIYPIETLKTQLMSSTINEKFQGRALLIYTIKRLNRTGGLRGYYTGITVAATGVFPYSAIDMSAFEMLKKACHTATGGTETGVIATLMCGAISGGVGASVVYPLNVVRTRLQAQGTPYHPQLYQGVVDCIRRTYLLEGWSGFYRGLAPSLLKVIPAVSISWLVYEQSNSLLDSLFVGS